MKKILVVTVFGWLVVMMLAITSCNDAKPTPGISCTNCQNDKFEGLTAEAFLRGIARYRKYQWAASNEKIQQEMPNTPFQDARSCWYSIDTLKKFICLLEKYCAENALNIPSDKLGIRFYYATYDQNEYIGAKMPLGLNPPDNYVGMHHTLFMVPTYSDTEAKLTVDLEARASLILSHPEIANQQLMINHPELILDQPEMKSKKPISPAQRKIVTVEQVYLANPQAKLFMLGSAHINGIGGQTDPSGKNQGQLCPPCVNGGFGSLSKVDAAYPDDKISKD